MRGYLCPTQKFVHKYKEVFVMQLYTVFMLSVIINYLYNDNRVLKGGFGLLYSFN